jgi:16S rRNA A1518/A1519 N6-dimethyltransferase RsmA/KsgA/DIM1 with predicted DNA glycosylase/AP lyase activity
MELNQSTCKAELETSNLIPKKYYGQVFTTDESVIQKLIDTIKTIYKPNTKIVEIGGGLGYITEALTDNFNDVDCVEIDDELFEYLNNKFVHSQNWAYIKEKDENLNKNFIHTFETKVVCHSEQSRGKNTKIIQQSRLRLIKKDILDYIFDTSSTSKDYSQPDNYMLVGNIPFHISGRLYRKFMSEIKHKPYGMVFITDKQYATTLMGQPPRCYRVSLQAQAYGDIEIIADVPPASVYPAPKVMSCIMKIAQNPTPLPQNFWGVVNYHYDNFPTKEVESPKTMSLQNWIDLAKKTKTE